MRKAALISIALISAILIGCGGKTYYDKRLGAEVKEIDSDLKGRWGLTGVVVIRVDPNGPAAEAGLREGDLIERISFVRRVRDGDELKEAMEEGLKAERMVYLELADGREILLAVRSYRDKTGVQFDGPVVKSISPSTPGYLSGLKPGDKVVAVKIVRTVRGLDDYKEIVRKARKYANEITFHTAELSGVKLAAIRALGEIGGPEAMGMLLKMLESKEELFREPAAKALERLSEQGSSPELIRAMIKHLDASNEPNPEIRASCATLLGKLKAVEAIPALIKALKDPVANVRFKAGVALSLIGEPAVDELIKALESSNDPIVQEIAVTALGDIGTPSCRDALIRAYGRIKSSSVRLSILDALAKIGDGRSKRFLKEAAVKEADPQVKAFLDALIAKVM